MKGIISYGAYIPYYRLQRKKIGEFLGSSVLGGEKAVAGYDEDSVSMGVEAARDCLKGIETDDLDAIFFATTSSPYKEKASAPIIGTALALKENIKSLEVSSSIRSGTSSIMLANPDEKTLIISSDCRTGGTGGQNEQVFGDGAACLLIGSGKNVIASIVEQTSFQKDVLTQWRGSDEDVTQNWEERLGQTVFQKQIEDDVIPFIKQHDIDVSALKKVIISGPGARTHSLCAKALSLEKQQIQDPLIDQVGAAGSAHASMMLISALQDAKPGDRIMVISFAEGLDLILFEVTEAIENLPERKGIRDHLNNKSNDISYSDYLKWRNLLKTEPARRPEKDRPSAPAVYRGHSQNIGLIGSKCRECGTPQFPKQRICVRCQAKDQMDDYRFVNQPAKITTYTLDYLSASPASPVLAAIIDFEGGGRILSEVTDCDPAKVEIGMEVEMTFRRLYTASGISNYFWKARPKWKKEVL